MLRYAANATARPLQQMPVGLSRAMGTELHFSQLHLPPPLVNRMSALGLTEATEIQAKALPKILAGTTTIAAAETGSGKTLVYLLPILAKAWTAARPGLQGLVIAPSQELAVQVCGVYDALHCKDAGSAVPAIRGVRLDAAKLHQVSMVVGTPGSLLGLLENAFSDQEIATMLRPCSYLAFDEADLLLSASHRSNVENIIKLLQSLKTGQPSKKTASNKAAFSIDHSALQCVAVAATLMDTGFAKPGSKGDVATASYWLHAHFRHAAYVSSSFFHRASKLTDFTEVEVHTSALLKLVDSTLVKELQDDQLSSLAQRAKFKALLQVLHTDPNIVARVVSAAASDRDAVTNLPHLSSLDENMVHSAYFDKASGESVVRIKPLESDTFLDGDGLQEDNADDGSAPAASSILVFANDAGTVEHLAKDLEAQLGMPIGALHKDVPLMERSATVADWFAGEFSIMVATDLAARGLDTVAHVIQYDLATENATFLHRVGRTGRAGQHGKVTSIFFDVQRDQYAKLTDTLRGNAPSTLVQRRDASYKSRRINKQLQEARRFS